jgi:anti-sigma-K factor RskA
MNRNPDKIEKLAAEYVLGTLQGPARRRFERWMMESWRVRQEVWFWENHLAGLMENMESSPAPTYLWPEIERRLGLQGTDTRHGSGWLKAWASLATVAALVLTILLAVGTVQPPTQAQYLAVVGGEEKPLWVMEADERAGEWRARAISAKPAGDNKDYELWILPRSGKPLSLGVLPADGERHVLHLSDSQRKQLIASGKLAISLEPAGGSPTGQPTGPVLYTTDLLSL